MTFFLRAWHFLRGLQEVWHSFFSHWGSSYVHTHTHNNYRMSAAISTGRGGAGNMISSSHSHCNHGGDMIMDPEDAANEVIMTQEEFNRYNNNSLDKYNEREKEKAMDDGAYYHDKDGKILASVGRGGMGNIGKFDKKPSALVDSENQEIELSPVFTTGRGGAGNIYRTKSGTKTKIPIEVELTDQLSPLHSNKSGRSCRSCRSSRSINGNINNKGKGKGNGIMDKIRKLFK